MLGFYKQISGNYWLVTLEDGEEIFVFKTKTKWSFSGDFVDVRILNAQKWERRREWIIINILKRTEEKLIWKFIKSSKQYAFVQVFNSFGKDIYIPEKLQMWAKDWDIVITKIREWKEKPLWEVLQIVGKDSDKNIEESILLIENNIELDFPKEVQNEAKRIDEKFSTKTFLDQEILRRTDLRKEFIITIDWADAKDLDDAISVQKLENWNYKLWVYIADVAQYVMENSILDKEALIRWTSIYLPELVIPMLPKELSNWLCSLNPNEPKLTLSIIMEIDKNGEVVERKILETVIESKYRMTYDEVAEIITWKNPQNRSKDLIEMLNLAKKLKDIIYTKRKKEWKIDFELHELKIEMWENKEVKNVYKYERNEAYIVIEEFMVIANEEVSKFFATKKIPFLYRLHEEPQKQDLQILAKILSNYWIVLNPEKANSKEIAQIIDSLGEKVYKYFLLKLILRSMSKACYSSEDVGHFWLGIDYYSHFTSPIRRYPDLQIHRIIKEYLNGRLDEKRMKHYKTILKNIADRTSATEIIAEDIERKVRYLKVIDFMSDKIWEKFSSIVSGVTENGFFVELESGVEWFVHKNSLKKLFVSDLDWYCFFIWKEKFLIWKEVETELIGTDRRSKKIDFSIFS